MEQMSTWQKLLLGASIALIGLEVISAFILEAPFAAVGYAILLSAGVVWMIRSDSRGPAVYLGVLLLIELLLVPSFASQPASETGGWALLAPVLGACIVGVAGAVGSLRTGVEPQRIR
ncbi:MAG: hypothetical protein GEU78_08960 [Actinobacteria bacterium]|nr:hypothetical protein [Actinomycetota bacterium]